jgi:hypothetical protein
MITILEILLYLQLISPNAGYTGDQINAIWIGNQPAVQSVQQDPNMMNQIDQQYNQQAQGIEKIDVDEGL